MVYIKGKNKSRISLKMRGMMTVEASFLIPMVIMAAGIMISLSIFVYQRCWYTQAACEAVLAGSTQGILKKSSGTEKAEERWNILKKECYPVPEEFSSLVSGSTDRVQIQITGSTPMWGRKGICMQISVSQKIVRPVKFIRKAAALIE
ncbi:MAG: TadE family protein [Oliverpabstia sp.]